MILGGSYSFIFNNQKIKKSRDYWFLRINAEAAGNLLGLCRKIANADKTEDAYTDTWTAFCPVCKDRH